MSIESVMPSNHLILCRPFPSYLQSFPALGSFQMSQLRGIGLRLGLENNWLYLWLLFVEILLFAKNCSKLHEYIHYFI